MIKLNEVREGNWVMLDNERVWNKRYNRTNQQITIDTLLEISSKQDYYSPIPLSKEFLVKNRFIEEINGHFCCKLMTHELELIESNGDFYPIYIQFAELSSENEQRVGLNLINNVHQLQNLYYFLTGNELGVVW